MANTRVQTAILIFAISGTMGNFAYSGTYARSFGPDDDRSSSAILKIQ